MAENDGQVAMRHPTHDPNGQPGYCTQRQFDEIWAPKGWQLVDQATVVASNHLGRPVDSVKNLSKEELVALASAQGLTLDGTETKSQLVELVEQAVGTEAAHG